jgi:hypothetical protein
LVIKGSKAPYRPNENPLETDPVVKKASQKAYEIYQKGS